MSLRTATVVLFVLFAVVLAGCVSPTPQERPTPAPRATPARSPASGKELTPTELKYRLFQEFGETFFCDPDFYPVPRADEKELARERFPQIQKDTEPYQAILRHLSLRETGQFGDEQKLSIYREYKRLNSVDLKPSGSRYEFRLRLPEEKGRGFLIEGEISPNGSIRVTKREPAVLTCPICLAEGTLVDTPAGQVPIERLERGMPVWTVDPLGNRVPATILDTAKAPVLETHQVVHLVLGDGRELYASPGHPTADGITVGGLSAGDVLDGATVVLTNLVPYPKGFTYDLLPSGETGLYFANGILLRSTLVISQLCLLAQIGQPI